MMRTVAQKIRIYIWGPRQVLKVALYMLKHLLLLSVLQLIKMEVRFLVLVVALLVGLGPL